MQVADRAMCFFENDYFLNILKTYKDKTFPILVPVIVDLAENHWHKILQESLIALRTILKEIDPVAFEEAQKMRPDQRKPFSVHQSEEERNSLDLKWQSLENGIMQRDSGFVAPTCPFVKDTLICDFNPLYHKIYDKIKAIEI